MDKNILYHYDNKGFTLIELLIAVAIISILAAIAVPNYNSAQTKSKIAVTQVEMKTLFGVVEQFKMDRNLMLVDGYDGLTDWGKERIKTTFNHVGLTPENRNETGKITRVMDEVFAPLTSPVSYISKLPTDPFQVSYVYYVDPLGYYTTRNWYFYEDNDPEIRGDDMSQPFKFNDAEHLNQHAQERTAAQMKTLKSLLYNPPLNTGEYLIRGYGPNSKNDPFGDDRFKPAYWSVPYTASNGIYSRGEFAYHSTHGFINYRYANESELDSFNW